MKPIGYLLAHVIMEAHRFPKEPGYLLLFPSWRTRNAGGLIISESKTWDPEMPKLNIRVQKKMEGLSSEKYQMCSSFTVLLNLGPLETGWGPSELLSWWAQMLTSFRITLTVTSRNKVLPTIWASIGPPKFTNKINHHSLVLCCEKVFLFYFPWVIWNTFQSLFLRKSIQLSRFSSLPPVPTDNFLFFS